MGIEDRDYYRSGGASGGGYLTTCPQCGRSLASTLWRMHAHNPQQAHCVEVGCRERAVGYCAAAPFAGGLGPLCGEHLMRHRRQRHDVRFVDGGVCSECDGQGHVSSQGVGQGAGDGWLRCLQCSGLGYESEDVRERRRERAREQADADAAKEERARLEEMFPQTEQTDGSSDSPPDSDERQHGEADGGGKGSDGRRCRLIVAFAPLAALAAIVGAFVYLNRQDPQPQVEPAPTFIPVMAAPTWTPEPTWTPAPTFTPTPTPRPTPKPTATPTAVPCADPTATPTPTVAPTSTPTPTPEWPPQPLTDEWRRWARGWSDQQVSDALAESAAAFETGLDALAALPLLEACARVEMLETQLEIAAFLVETHRLERAQVPGWHIHEDWSLWLRHQRGLLGQAVRDHAPAQRCREARAAAATPTPTATSTPSPAPTASLASSGAPLPPCPTATPDPRATPTPTATPTPRPTATPTPRPTARPTPRPTPTPRPRPTPTHTPTPRPTATPLRPSTGQESLEEVAARVRTSVVYVTAGRGAGSGVIVETDSSGAAVVVTNHHVIEDAPGRVRVQVNDNRWFNATVLGSDADRDIAALSICCSPNFRAASLSGARAPQGASVFAMGYPVDIFDSGEPSLTNGVVSRVFLDTRGRRWLVQTNAEINPGNSGGPLFAMSGEVVGINAFIQRETAGGLNIEGYGFAVASETVIDLLPALRGGRTFGATPTPRPRPTPTPRGGLLRNFFGPADGTIYHDNDGYIEAYEANVHVSDFRASATFVNPSSAGWDYGFLFRWAGQNRFHVVALTSRGRWVHDLRDGSANSIDLDSGWTNTLRTQAGASNELFLAVIGSVGWLYVNDEIVATLNLEDGASSGDIAVMTGYHRGAETPGSETRFRGFSVLGVEG